MSGNEYCPLIGERCELVEQYPDACGSCDFRIDMAVVEHNETMEFDID